MSKDIIDSSLVSSVASDAKPSIYTPDADLASPMIGSESNVITTVSVAAIVQTCELAAPEIPALAGLGPVAELPAVHPSHPMARDADASNLRSAMRWFGFLGDIVPTRPGTSEPAAEFGDLSVTDIVDHYTENPNHQVGVRLGAGLVVLEATDHESLTALNEIENLHHAVPKMVATAGAAEQHFYRTGDSVDAWQDLPCQAAHEMQIGVMTGGVVVSLPPSNGQTLLKCDANNVGELTIASEALIADVCEHNASVGHVLVVDDSGLSASNAPEPANELSVPPCPDVPVPMSAGIANATPSNHPLLRYSLRDCLPYLERQMVAQVLILGQLVLLGQSSVIYALAGTGKTLLVLYMILEAIKKGLIDPLKLIYINMDDNSSGLVDKVGIAQEFDFHMLADGHQGFEAKKFRGAMEKMTADGTARGVIVVLDTLKKFVDTMHKGRSAEFAGVVRRFVLAGGMVIALAHANKKPGPDGKPIYSGTTDIVDDFDCAFTLATVSKHENTNQKVVEFVNFKGRGKGDASAAYCYSTDRNLSYNELLLSVQEVDPEQLVPIKHAVEVESDAVVITAIEACIDEGTVSKMMLVDAAAKRADIPKRAVLRVIEKYCGPDPALHRWTYTVRERGAKVFARLEPTAGSSTGSSPATT